MRMWQNLSNWLYRFSSGWVTITAVAVFLLFVILVLPGQSSGGSEAAAPDLSLYYSAEKLYHMADEYGEAGRNAYIRARFTFDLIWPLVYTFFLAVTISWLFNRTLSLEAGWRRLNLAPVIGMLFDYLENISTSLVFWRFPEQIPLISSLAGIFTAFKWLFVVGSFLLLVYGSILFIGKVLKDFRLTQ